MFDGLTMVRNAEAGVDRQPPSFGMLFGEPWHMLQVDGFVIFDSVWWNFQALL